MDSADPRKSLKSEFKDLMNTTFQDLDEEFEKRVKARPQLLSHKDETGKTLLHHGILRHISTTKILCMLNIKGDLVKIPVNDQLPLNMLLDEDLDPQDVETVAKLFSFYPAACCERDHAGMLPGWPLHKIVRKAPFYSSMVVVLIDMLNAYPEAVHIKVDGNLALHSALEEPCKPESAIKALIGAYPGAAAVPNKAGDLPLHVAVKTELEVPIIVMLLSAYPAALIEPVLPRGALAYSRTTIIEYAFRHKAFPDVIDALLKGGDTSDLKAYAYAHAAVYSLQSRDAPKDYDVDEGHDEADVQVIQERRRRLYFHVLPPRRQAYRMDMPADAIVLDLKVKLSDIECTPTAGQKLTLDGQRLRDTVPLSEYITDRRTVIEMHYETSLLHLALTNNAKDSNILTLLDMREEFATEDDARGILPLHVALHSSSPSEEVLKVLYGLYPEAADKRTGGVIGEFPLETAFTICVPDPLIEMLAENVTESDWSKDGFFCPKGASEPDHVATPLLFIAIMNDCSLGILKRLLDTKCPIGPRDPNTGYSALEFTLIYNSPPQTFFLILEATAAHDYNFNSVLGPNGRTVVHVACTCASPVAFFRKLYKSGDSCLEVRDNDGNLPIHLAARSSASFDVIRDIASRKPLTVLEEDSRGRLPLHVAIINKPKPGVVFELARLLTAGADSVRDDGGRTLLQIAVSIDAPVHVIQELLEAAPKLLNNVNLVDGKWPMTTAGKEVRRLALLQPAERRALQEEKQQSPTRRLPTRPSAVTESNSPSAQESSSYLSWLTFGML